MPTRFATRRYPDALSFWLDHQSMIARGSMLLPPDALDDEPAPELRIDVVVPGSGRIGPIEAQVVNRLQDGSVAVRVESAPEALGAAATQIQGVVDGVRAWLVRTRQLVPPPRLTEPEVAALEGRVQELEGLLARSEAQRAEIAATLARAAATGTAPAAPPEEGAAPRGRGFPVPVLTGPPRFSGSLGDKSLRQALMAVAVEKGTGLLTLDLPGGVRRWGFWQKGGPVGWRAEPVQEAEVMGVLLFRANQLTREQLAQSLALMEERGLRQGEALIEMGVITFAQLVLILQKQADFVMGKVLSEREGSWTFHDVPEHVERFVPPPARVAAMLFRGLRAYAKEMPAEELAGALRPHLDEYVYLATGVQRTLDEMRLSPDESQFVKILTATSYRLRELSAVSNLSRSQTAGMVWCLMDLGLLEFRSQEADARATDRISRELLGRKALVQKGTLFDRLEVHWMCSTAEVEAAWVRLRPLYGEDQLDKFGPTWRPTMELIHEKTVEAYQRLRADKTRREYRAEVVEKMMIEQSAIMLAQKGEMAFMKENAKEAYECFSRAAELYPGKPEYVAGLQKARAAGGGA